MDATTENGIKAIQQARAGLIATGIPFVETPQDEPADVDGFFLNADETEVVACFEAKARSMSLAELKEMGGEWLMSAQKVVKGREMARRLRVPFYGVLYLVPDKITMLVLIADKDGEIACGIRYAVTETQATCNGGTARRKNAFIDMKQSKRWRAK